MYDGMGIYIYIYRILWIHGLCCHAGVQLLYISDRWIDAFIYIQDGWVTRVALIVLIVIIFVVVVVILILVLVLIHITIIIIIIIIMIMYPWYITPQNLKSNHE